VVDELKKQLGQEEEQLEKAKNYLQRQKETIRSKKVLLDEEQRRYTDEISRSLYVRAIPVFLLTEKVPLSDAHF
jgi:hypothetical protein